MKTDQFSVVKGIIFVKECLLASFKCKKNCPYCFMLVKYKYVWQGFVPRKKKLSIFNLLCEEQMLSIKTSLKVIPQIWPESRNKNRPKKQNKTKNTFSLFVLRRRFLKSFIFIFILLKLVLPTNVLVFPTLNKKLSSS